MKLPWLLMLATMVLSAAPIALAEEPAGAAGNAFFESLTIIVREGLEAILIIGAIIAYIAASGHKDKTKGVYAGATAAIIASILTAIIVDGFFKASDSQLEALEGTTMLIAAIVMLYVTNWMLGKIDSARWTAYIKGKAGDALTSGSVLALGIVSFLAVYREGFETVLFYKALAIGSADTAGIISGFVAGIIVLAALFLAIIKLETKLPLNWVFGGTSALLFLLSVKFAGKGIHEFQEAGIISETAMNILPKVKDLGIYPTVETLGAQAVIIIIGAALLHIHIFRRRADMN
ncbi:MAG: FTR1 family protein [Candidatus Diapherotrites archaeon]|uniref:FTR1 family protein n=1 Tax=Candidatus Iainarchaeum sp. TaxID=3101447 RepID=A0A8T3YMB9_9ARCH|nr:FTR1 family protein [Candidatus Diapherotrites archaeon]